MNPRMPALKKFEGGWWHFNSLKYDILPEEDLGVAKPEFVLVKFDNVHHCLGGGFVVLGLCDCGGSQNVVTLFEVRIKHLQQRNLSCCKYNVKPTLFGNPARQIAIPARTPLHWYWCITRADSTPPGCLCVFGTTQRMKWGCVL